MNNEEIYYTIALTRQPGISQTICKQLYNAFEGGKSVYEHRNDIGDVLSEATPQLCKAIADWDESLRRADAEMNFIERNDIRPLSFLDKDYPARLRECPDAPIILFYKGNANLNQQHIINIVGTRHSTSYGQDLVRKFITDLKHMCPDVLIVSGLAYGIDICAHRNALENGFETVGVLAHGLDQIYPSNHRETATKMTSHGGLLTEYMSLTQALPNNFRMRNRIVAGMSDATILVESAIKGGGLITCRIAQEYGRDVFAFPGAVGMKFSEGCHKMIRNNTAALITSAQDFIDAIGWPTLKQKPEVIERELFPQLTDEEQAVVTLLQDINDLQLNQISVKTDIPIGQLAAILFSLEMKGVVKPLAGGTYHLLF